MIDINEMRSMVKGSQFESFANFVINSLLDRLEAVEKERNSYKAAYNEWLDKTELVQQGINAGTISAKYLGLHRADVMTNLLAEAEKERDDLRAEVQTWQEQAKAYWSKIEQMEKQEPVAWLDDGTCRAGSEATAHRVITNETKRDMPASVAASFSVPLYALPGAKGE